MNLPLFDPAPKVDTFAPVAPKTLQSLANVKLSRSDVARVIEHKAGPFREVREGKVTRQFRILELHSGQLVGEWEDGTRFRPWLSFSADSIAGGLRIGMLVEVRA